MTAAAHTSTGAVLWHALAPVSPALALGACWASHAVLDTLCLYHPPETEGPTDKADTWPKRILLLGNLAGFALLAVLITVGVLSPWCLLGAAVAWFGFDWEWAVRHFAPAFHARWRAFGPHALFCDTLRRWWYGTPTPSPRVWAMSYEVAAMLLPVVVLL